MKLIPPHPLFKRAGLLLAGLICGLSGLSSAPVHAAQPEIPAPPAGGAWIGDFGHYLTGGTTEVFLFNPDGRPFSVSLHRYNWTFKAGTAWNNPQLGIRITGPDGSVVVNTNVHTHEAGAEVEVEDAQPGVYSVMVRAHGLNYWHLHTTLPHAVASADQARAFTATPLVPRRWYFYVPEETDYFTIKTWGHGGRSQREDHGLTLRSPIGQRMGMLWDNPNPQVRDGEIIWGRHRDDLEEVLHVVVEPGSDGRFWSLEIEMGDAHIWSNFPVALERVPPYLAPSPEQWFDPDAGKVLPPKQYEHTAYVRKLLPEDGAERWPHFAHWMPGAVGGRKDWMPVPALGSNASNHLRTPTRFALWNPEGRDLDLYLWDYVPRDPQEENTAQVRVFDSNGKLLETEKTGAIGHGGGFKKTLAFQGVRLIEVDQIERFWAFTYPGTPAVLVGDALDNDWHRFRIESGARRHWYFMVPTGTRTFSVRAATGMKSDIVSLDVNGPDRIVRKLYGSSGEVEVEVPAGLDGKIWHLSIGVGDTTRYFPPGDQARHGVIDLDLDLRGVPPYLAPSWEQWFDPTLVK